MPDPEGRHPPETSYVAAYYRVLGEDAGRALRPLLMSFASLGAVSEWEKVRSGLATLNPWLAKVIDNMAAREPLPASNWDRARRKRREGPNTFHHKRSQR